MFWVIVLYKLYEPIDNSELLAKILAYRAEQAKVLETPQETEADVFDFDEENSHPKE